MVLAITGYVWQRGIGAVFRRDTVHITEGGVQGRDRRGLRCAGCCGRPPGRVEF
ncbi:peptidase, M24 family domain protein [Mycobacterium avium MAV_120709_2344]|nr:peptidase, M24 family domain protein [Mycobacterium avium MAV_120709_2344]ETZ69062.1 peptidase, M24 family domain protein [Mycobacterium sp. MAC_011194_8550]ETZ72537.1 peptidase, M24 family domain protein [Mycobacterium sp. MAC_080597_8934]